MGHCVTCQLFFMFVKHNQVSVHFLKNFKSVKYKCELKETCCHGNPSHHELNLRLSYRIFLLVKILTLSLNSESSLVPASLQPAALCPLAKSRSPSLMTAAVLGASIQIPSTPPPPPLPQPSPTTSQTVSRSAGTFRPGRRPCDTQTQGGFSEANNEKKD